MENSVLETFNLKRRRKLPSLKTISLTLLNFYSSNNNNNTTTWIETKATCKCWQPLLLILPLLTGIPGGWCSHWLTLCCITAMCAHVMVLNKQTNKGSISSHCIEQWVSTEAMWQWARQCTAVDVHPAPALSLQQPKLSSSFFYSNSASYSRALPPFHFSVRPSYGLMF